MKNKTVISMLSKTSRSWYGGSKKLTPAQRRRIRKRSNQLLKKTHVIFPKENTA